MRSSGCTITASPSASPSSTCTWVADRKPVHYALYRVVDGRARLTSVRTGLRSATHVQALGGLAEGDAVIVQPDERLVAGTRIEAH